MEDKYIHHNQHIGDHSILNRDVIESLTDNYWKSGIQGSVDTKLLKKARITEKSSRSGRQTSTRVRAGAMSAEDSLPTHIEFPSNVFHRLPIYEHLQDSWQSVRFLQGTVGLRAKTTHRRKTHVVSSLMKLIQMLLVRDWEIYLQNLGLALGARLRNLSAEFRTIMSFNFVQDFSSPPESESDFSNFFGPPI